MASSSNLFDENSENLSNRPHFRAARKSYDEGVCTLESIRQAIFFKKGTKRRLNHEKTMDLREKIMEIGSQVPLLKMKCDEYLRYLPKVESSKCHAAPKFQPVRRFTPFRSNKQSGHSAEKPTSVVDLNLDEETENNSSIKDESTEREKEADAHLNFGGKVPKSTEKNQELLALKKMDEVQGSPSVFKGVNVQLIYSSLNVPTSTRLGADASSSMDTDSTDDQNTLPSQSDSQSSTSSKSSGDNYLEYLLSDESTGSIERGVQCTPVPTCDIGVNTTTFHDEDGIYTDLNTYFFNENFLDLLANRLDLPPMYFREAISDVWDTVQAIDNNSSDDCTFILYDNENDILPGNNEPIDYGLSTKIPNQLAIRLPEHDTRYCGMEMDFETPIAYEIPNLDSVTFDGTIDFDDNRRSPGSASVVSGSPRDNEEYRYISK